MPMRARTKRPRSVVAVRWANAMSAMMPPSPRLSARMMTSTYFTVTVSISDQKISDRMPRISQRSIPPSSK